MVVERSTGRIATGSFEALFEHLRSGDVLVRNNTRVLAARLRGSRLGRSAADGSRGPSVPLEVLLCHPLRPGVWEALARPAKRLRAGDEVEFPDGTRARVTGEGDDGYRAFDFGAPEAAMACMERSGAAPVPPYVKQVPEDFEDYQTVYASAPGAVAAPTAGFHFTGEDFARLGALGVEIADVTLHVGPGTFLPMRCERLEDHRMHREWYEVGPATLRMLARARREGRRVVALGTTSVRVLESLPAELEPHLAAEAPLQGWTELFIRPGHRFRRVGALLTNFHLPRSSLLVLVSALGGLELIRRAYAHAIAESFRFYSFGDAMLIV